ncbi:flagellar assembly protein FliW [Curtobacterium sp. MCJR17_055]|uniref:flagellar assembly protein FliW n=1 Tax=unclassified Curtobacterium TaxID=257496 RepID=UPI000D9D03FB|nr:MULTISPECIES: flagellar assembly protein FliW [unclassified Curtobacterium]PYY33116.1 flagellar assembly protein FliW [Curtobacterium sp. MCBD17_029]PYY43324.1 flagellar assembly protein FliW [Curtobacterium sp. MCPF17_046]PYY50914.1 flagellar assembly protein FliW [Curtobacterium sp. MCBD17_023]PYY53828.1 flagellar assembly protein FliW [Curtobacterium sp. MCJR17_055]PYY59284.1 flagellar assembly protein FliW [Curtobacterium sp. MCPF17_015]
MSIDLTFTVAPFGLEPLRSFTLDPVDGADGLFALVGTGTTDSGVTDPRLYLLDAAVHLPDYAPVLADEQADRIGLERAEEAMLLVVANPDAAGTTVNLLAPVVVNARTAVGAQFILEDQDLPIRAELAHS